MTQEERQQHIDHLKDLRAIYSTIVEGPHSKALTAAIAALEREDRIPSGPLTVCCIDQDEEPYNYPWVIEFRDVRYRVRWKEGAQVLCAILNEREEALNG